MHKEAHIPEAPAAAPKAKREKKPKTHKVVYISFARDIAGDAKYNRTQQVILDVIKAECDLNQGKADRKAVLARLTPEALLTKQKVSEVFGFYMYGWKKDGLFKVESVDVPAITPAA